METQVYKKPQEHKTILPLTNNICNPCLGTSTSISWLLSVSQDTCSAFIALQNVSISLQMWKDMDQKASMPRVE